MFLISGKVVNALGLGTNAIGPILLERCTRRIELGDTRTGELVDRGAIITQPYAAGNITFLRGVNTIIRSSKKPVITKAIHSCDCQAILGATFNSCETKPPLALPT